MAQSHTRRGPGGGPHGIGMKGDKPKSFRGTSKRLLSYLKSYWFGLLIVVICIMLAASATIYSGIFLGSIIDNNLIPMLRSGVTNFAPLAILITRYAIIMVSGAIAIYIYSRIMLNIAQKVLKVIRDQMFTHMEGLPLKYFDTTGHGDIMSRYTNDIDAMVNLLTQSLPQVIANTLQMIGVFVAMLVLSWQLAAITVGTLFLMFMVLKVLGSNSSKYFSKQQKSLGAENAYIEEMTSGIKTIKVYNHEEFVKKNFDKLNEELCDNTTKANMYSNIFMPVMMGLGYVQYALLGVVGAIFGVNGMWGITLGIIVSFLQLSKSLTEPLARLGQQVNAVVQAVAGAERVFNLIDEEIEEDLGTVELVNLCLNNENNLIASEECTGKWAWKKKDDSFIPLHGDVKLKDVDFSYNPGNQILHGVNVYAHPGQVVAFVGSTGAGKTTITNLINRFYEVEKGEILYDGIPVKDIKKDSLRRSLGMVLQDTSLFSGTIKENIRFGKLDATDEEVINAARLANADFFISLLPEGYDTFLNGEDNLLSVGQRQLLSIARVAIANPPVMILDEATSSIDTRTEAHVQEGMNRLMKGKTVFIIAHRLSTIRNCDVIMVMEDGRIIERGSHKELLDAQGAYYALYTGKKQLA
jgi:ATP-binding cassette subfamily B protein